ncbi:MAG: TraB/GumN family protein [Chitinophagales bacterium]|nr:TraB/GumN family protein [Chitinophagales bacterium]
MDTAELPTKGTTVNRIIAISFLTALILATTALLVRGQGNDKAVLWRVSGNGLKNPSYLFATLEWHDTAFLATQAQVLPFLDSVKVVLTESDYALPPTHSELSLFASDNRFSIKQQLTPDEYKLLTSYCSQNYGISVIDDRIKPIYPYLLLSTHWAKDTLKSIEWSLYQKAIEKGKTCYGYLSLKEQMANLDSLTLSEQTALLKGALKDLGKEKNHGKVVQAYMEGDLEEVQKLYRKNVYPGKLFFLLCWNDNASIAAKIEQRMQMQPALIAVPAQRLGKEGGIIELLRKKGYVLEPIKPN